MNAADGLSRRPAPRIWSGTSNQVRGVQPGGRREAATGGRTNGRSVVPKRSATRTGFRAGFEAEADQREEDGGQPRQCAEVDGAEEGGRQGEQQDERARPRRAGAR